MRSTTAGAGRACAVIEDAVVGIEAANRAGMLSIALVTDQQSVDAFSHADHIVHALCDLSPEIIRHWIRERS